MTLAQENGNGRNSGISVREIKAFDTDFIIQPHGRSVSSCPIFDELKGLVNKTAGVADVLRGALEPLRKRLSFALVYGSVARGDAGKGSDIDLLVVGEVGFEDVVNMISAVQETVRREVNPLVMSPEEFRNRLDRKDHLLNSILKSSTIPIVGDAHELVRAAKKRLAH